MAQHADPSIASFEAMEVEALEGPNIDRPRLPSPPAPGAAEAVPAEGIPGNSGKLHFTLGVDVTNAYFARGIAQETDGVIAQPYLSLAADIYESGDFSLQANVNTWQSVHSKATGATTTDDYTKRWYESDVALGLTATTGDFTIVAQYLWPMGPNGALETAEEINFSLAYNDEDLLGAWKLSPSIFVAVETGSSTGDGVRPTGAYLQLGVAPGFSFESGAVGEVGVAFPVLVGTSLSNFYQDGAGSNDFFGFASLGAKASVPINMPAGYGDWTLSAGVNALVLGDATSEINEGDEFELVATVGLSIAY